MIEEEFKAYQKALNIQRVNALKENPIPTSLNLLEPKVKITSDIDLKDLILEEIPINIKIEVLKPKPEPKIDSKNIPLF